MRPPTRLFLLQPQLLQPKLEKMSLKALSESRRHNAYSLSVPLVLQDAQLVQAESLESLSVEEDLPQYVPLTSEVGSLA